MILMTNYTIALRFKSSNFAVLAVQTILNGLCETFSLRRHVKIGPYLQDAKIS